MSEIMKYLSSCPLSVLSLINITMGFLGDSVVKNLPANAGNDGSIPGSGRYPAEGNGNPLQYPCLGNAMDRGAWPATAPGITRESNTTE